MYLAEERRRALERNDNADTAANIWPCYFREAEFAIDDRKYKLVAELADFFSSPQADTILSNVQYDSSVFLPIDFQQLQKVCLVEGFYADLREMPKEALLCMGAAAHVALLLKGNDYHIVDAEKINIRLYNHPDSLIMLKSLKAAYIGKLVSIHGTVVKVSTVRPLITLMDFSCAKCGTTITRAFPDGKFSPPIGCTIHGCRSRTFSPVRSTAKAIDFQKVRIQEILKFGIYEEGRVPRTVECELTADLVDFCIPGDIVTVTGIIKVINNYMDVGGGKFKTKNQGLYYLNLEAVSVRNSKSHAVSEEYQPTNSETRSNTLCDLHTFSPKDLEFIVKFLDEHGPDTFRQIVQSFCPSIYGHEFVKAGITLALFGGVQKYSMDENKVPVRGDIHVIVVGDPGLGKSQLLQAAAAVSPRGIYVCGNATTNAGLTVAVVKDHMTSDYAFEAGAMVLADGGSCCIDEFDKMSAEHQALLEAMEQQCVSVAKAGLVASLSARTSVLAAANPVGGHYKIWEGKRACGLIFRIRSEVIDVYCASFVQHLIEGLNRRVLCSTFLEHNLFILKCSYRAKTVNENLKMRAALLSRFDLVFILLDKPDEVLDKRVSDHIMALHTGNGERLFPAKKLSRVLESCGDIACGATGSLVSRLRLDLQKDKDFVPLPGPLLRKYIAYARTYIFPRMSRPAADILQKFYLRLRDRNTSADGTPITARQLESLVRLAEARARLDLREEITAKDAMDVVEIMKESLYEKLLDEHGFVDFARSGGMSRQKEAKRFLSALHKQSEINHDDCFSISDIYSLADTIGLRVPDIDTIVDNLNSAGYLLKKGAKVYQVLSSSFS